MEQGNDTLRERLLSRLPQPENLAAYREETTYVIGETRKSASLGQDHGKHTRFPHRCHGVPGGTIDLGDWTKSALIRLRVDECHLLFPRGAIYSGALRNLRQPSRHSQGNQAGSIADPRTSGFAAKGSLTSVLIAQKTALMTARLEVPLIDAARAAGRQKQILHPPTPWTQVSTGPQTRSVQDDTVVDVCGFPPLTR